MSFSFSVILCRVLESRVADEVVDVVVLVVLVVLVLLLVKADCATAVGPRLTGSSAPVIFFSPCVMSWMTCAVSGWPACACAFAVGPFCAGPALPVSCFSASVICDINAESTVTRMRRVSEKPRVSPWLLRSFMRRNRQDRVDDDDDDDDGEGIGRAKRTLPFMRASLDAIFFFGLQGEAYTR